MREQSLVVEGIEVLRGRFPIPVFGINSDNDSAFINDSMFTYCREKKFKFVLVLDSIHGQDARATKMVNSCFIGYGSSRTRAAFLPLHAL